jgi:hypothetical protein
MISIIFLIILAYLFFAFSSKTQKTGSGETVPATSSDQPSSKSTYNNQSSFPSSSTQNSTSSDATKKILPDDNTSYSVINNANNQEETQKSFDSFTSKKASDGAKPIKWTVFSDSNKNIIPLSSTAKNLGLNLKASLVPFLDSTDYEFFHCTLGNKDDYGLQMTIKYIPGYNGDEFDDAIKFMKDWESSILSDTYSILFPGIQFTSTQLQQTLAFKNGEYRYANVVLPDNTKKSINYGLVGNYLVLSSSPECLNKASLELIAPSK